MAADRASQQIDEYIEKAQPFAIPILKKLRAIIHSTNIPIVEEVKWNSPCYSHKGLVCMTWSFKKHAAIHFFKGALLADPYKVLVEGPGGNVSARSILFHSIQDVNEKIIAEYVREAVLVNEQGLKIVATKTERPPLEVPEDMLKAIKKSKAAKVAFENFAPSHKREYVNYVNEAKRVETRLKRIEKVVEALEKKALKDEIKNTKRK